MTSEDVIPRPSDLFIKILSSVPYTPTNLLDKEQGVRARGQSRNAGILLLFLPAKWELGTWLESLASNMLAWYITT